jgi:DNA repair protein RadC
MKIKDLPWYDQPGFKLTKKGVHTLTDVELLSIIFWSNDKNDNVLEISNKILKKHKLNNIEKLGYNELVNLICNKKKAKYSDFMKAMKLFSLIELSKRYNRLMNKGHKLIIKNAKDVYDLLVDRYGTLKQEYFICLYLDTKNKIIKEERVFKGTLNSSLVHPREVFKTAIKESANSIILVHNHPSGDCNPSVEDERITLEFQKAGEILGIKILDHIIIGKEGYYSWKEENKI